MLHKKILVKLHAHLGLSMFRARNDPGHRKHKHPKFGSYKNGETMNPLYFKDNGDFVAATPHTGDLALMDFDCHPDHRDDWDSLTPPEARKLLEEYIREFKALIPNWDSKVLCQHPSGSGKGIHVWFRRSFNPENELNGRPRFQGGDLFVGKSYAILYQPNKLWQAVKDKWKLVRELTDADIELIKAHRRPVRKPSAKPKRASADIKKPSGGSFAIRKLPSAQELAEKFGNGGDCSRDVLKRLRAAAGEFWHETASSDPEYPWTFCALAGRLSLLPYGCWVDDVCRDIAGMAVCHVNPDDGRLLDFYKACPCVDAKAAEAKWKQWRTMARTYKEPVNMGKICELVRLISQRPRVPVSRTPERIALKSSMDEFFASLVATPGRRISCTELYQAFNDASISQTAFIRFFKSNWMRKHNAKPTRIQISKGRNPTAVRGFSGISLKPKIAGPCTEGNPEDA